MVYRPSAAYPRNAPAVGKEFRQIEWDESVEEDCREIVRLAVREDLDRMFDWTTVCLVASGVQAQAAVVARRAGVVAGLRAAEVALSEMDAQVRWSPAAEDGQSIAVGQALATIAGSAQPADRRADPAESDRPPVGHRHAHAALRRRGRRNAARESTTLARRRPAGGGWKNTRSAWAAVTIIAPVCSTRS